MKSLYKRILLPLFCLLFLIGPTLLTSWLIRIDLPEKGQPALFYANQNRNDLEHTFLKAIEEANRSIVLFIYTLSDQKIIEALSKRAEEGIEVQVFTDHKQAWKVPKKFRPALSLNSYKGKGLMHHKILVIDGTVVWTGSANFTADSLQRQPNLFVGMHSPEMATFVQKKTVLFREKSKESLPSQTFSVGGQKIEFWFLPDCKEAKARVLELIRTAEKTIKVAMFTWTEQEIAQEVIDASKRGVTVEVVVDKGSGKGVSKKVVALFQKAHVPISLSRSPSLMHHKFAYIDGKTLIQGSTNWTKAAFARNDDNFTVFHDLTKKQKKKIDAVWNAQKFASYTVE